MRKENKPRTVVFLEQFLSGDQLSVFPLSSFIHLVLCDLMFSTMISAKFIFFTVVMHRCILFPIKFNTSFYFQLQFVNH